MAVRFVFVRPGIGKYNPFGWIDDFEYQAYENLIHSYIDQYWFIKHDGNGKYSIEKE